MNRSESTGKCRGEMGEVKEAVIQSAEQRLCRKKRSLKPWILQETLKLVEVNGKAFVD